MQHSSDTSEAVRRIEQCLGVPLPIEYREYIFIGMPWDEERCVFNWNPPGDYPFSIPYSTITVRHPYPPASTIEGTPTIEFMIDLQKQRMPGDGLIPEDAICIADSESGEDILLFVRGNRRGQVWLKDWRQFEEEGIDDPEACLHLIASNFTEFIGMLTKEKEREEPDDQEVVVVYLPDPGRALMRQFGIKSVALRRALQDNEAGQCVADGFYNEEFRKLYSLPEDTPVLPDRSCRWWSARFMGADAERIVDVLLPILRCANLPQGSFLMVGGKHPRRISL